MGILNGGISSIQQKVKQQKQAKKGQYIKHKNNSGQRRGELKERKIIREKSDILEKLGP